MDLTALVRKGEESEGTIRRVALAGSASVDALLKSIVLCRPEFDVFRLFVTDTVSFRRLLPARFALAADFLVVSENRRVLAPGVNPALVNGVE